jgi:predicted ATPase
MKIPVYLKKVAIKDYKSIASCDVELGPLTFLVGPNGSGKAISLTLYGFARMHCGIHWIKRSGTEVESMK